MICSIRTIMSAIALTICLTTGYGQPGPRHETRSHKMYPLAESVGVDSTLKVNLQGIEKDYGITVFCQQRIVKTFEDVDRPDSVRIGHLSYHLLDSSDLQNLNKLLKIFSEEWKKYPVGFVRNSGLKAVVFVGSLAVANQRRYAMPAGPEDALYYDVTFAGTSSDQYLRHSMHHEFYHLIQYHYMGSYYYKDPTWASFNSPEFSYGAGGKTAYAKPTFSKTKHPRKGFVTGYATYGLEEDMAEVFGYLMTSTGFNHLLKWTKKDDILSKKVVYLLGTIAFQCPELNLPYLKDLHSGGVNR